MRTCLVCGNGPSLADVRNDTLSRFTTFGANRCYKKFVPDYYVHVDPMLGRSNVKFVEEINALKTVKFVSTEFAPIVDDCNPLDVIHVKGFSYDPLSYVYGYFSVITVMLQLALFYGYKRVGLVGVDHRYQTPRGPRAFHRADEDRNHFCADYYEGYLDHWNAPKLDKLEEWFELAKEEYKKSGAEIVNLTPNSALKVFRFDRLENWL